MPGAFISWLETKREDSESKHQNMTEYFSAFVPAISPRKPQVSRVEHDDVQNRRIDHQIAATFEQIAVAETKFKEAERVLHFGAPSYDKIKQFLLHLTWLRARELECRELLVKKNQRLQEQCDFLSEQDKHNRKQLEFFVDGFSKLRKRHDDLIERSAQLSAYDTACQSMYLGLFGTEQVVSTCLANNLRLKDVKHQQIEQELREAHVEIERLKIVAKEKEDEAEVQKDRRRLARKDAGCARMQLRRCRKKLQLAKHESQDSTMLRQHLGLLRRQILTAELPQRQGVLELLQAKKPAAMKKAVGAIRQKLSSTRDISRTFQPQDTYARYISPQRYSMNQDTATVVQGIVLVGVENSGRATQAALLSESYGYVLVEASSLDLDTLVDRLTLPDCQTHGFVLYGWKFTKTDIDTLLVRGVPIDLVLLIQVDLPTLEKRLAPVTAWNPLDVIASEKPLAEKVQVTVNLVEENEHFATLMPLAFRFGVIDGCDSRNGVYDSIQNKIETCKVNKCHTRMVWDDETVAMEECNQMFENEIYSRLIPNPTKKKKEVAKKGPVKGRGKKKVVKRGGSKAPSPKKKATSSPKKGAKKPGSPTKKSKKKAS